MLTTALGFLRQNDLWADAIQIARKNTFGETYIVGGAMYRNMAYALYGREMHKPVEYDFDFLCDEIRQVYLPYGWEWTDNLTTSHTSSSGYSQTDKVEKFKIPPRYSVTAIHTTGIKVDLISSRDVARQQATEDIGPETYFSAVPLDIQRVAVDIECGELFSNEILGIVKAREVRIGNPNAFDIYNAPIDIVEYGKAKAASIGFRFVGEHTHKCHCEYYMVINRGCQCGGI